MTDRPRPADIWIHAASVGELTSAQVVIRALAARHAVMITTNSLTGRDLAQGWGLPARLAPLDLPGALTRHLEAVRPRLTLTVEGEFWPLRARMLAERDVRQAMIGARMSERSARMWGRFPRLIAPLLGRLDALSAQDGASEARLLTLGLPVRALLPRLDLKLLAPASVPLPPDDPDRDGCVLAASTHEGEDGVLLDAFVRARQGRPDLRMILAPRHPRRADAIAALIADRALPMARRRDGADRPPAGGVLLADTLGEMPRWYSASRICIIGGSFRDHGGHTPWEPAAHGCALIHGPNVANFTEAFDALTQAGAARTGDPDAALAALVADPARARSMGRAARALLEARAGDPGPLIARLDDLAQAAPPPDIRDR